MKRFVFLCFTLCVFNVFGQDTLKNDPYQTFDPTNHFKPKLEKGAFFSTSGETFLNYIADPLYRHMKWNVHDFDKAKTLSFEQKSLLYWVLLDGFILNGGFSAYYESGLAPCLPVTISGLKFIGDTSMADLLQKFESIRLNNQKIISSNPKSTLLATAQSDLLYVGLNEEEYEHQRKTTILKMEAYVRAHIDDYGMDENGHPFDTRKTGIDTTFYPSGVIKELFSLRQGILEGYWYEYYPGGRLHFKKAYDKGRLTGELVEWYENGNKKYEVQHDVELVQALEWHDNGQLAERGTYDKDGAKSGIWVQYYPDGRPSSEIAYSKGSFTPLNAWNEQGVQTLINGTGYFTHGKNATGSYDVYTYQDSLQHGIQKTYFKGRKRFEWEMFEGKQHGYHRSFFSNGSIEAETIYEHGKGISSKSYPKFANPRGVIRLSFFMTKEWLQTMEFAIPDQYPACINETEVIALMTCPDVLLQKEYHESEANTSFLLTVDEMGNVTEAQFLSAFLTNGSELQAVVNKLKFSPAMQSGRAIPSLIRVMANYSVE